MREPGGGGGVCLRAPTVRPGPPALWQIPLHSPLSPFLPAGRTPLGLQAAARGPTGAPCAQESESSRPGVVEDRAGRFLPGPSRGWREGQSSGAPAREARTGARPGAQKGRRRPRSHSARLGFQLRAPPRLRLARGARRNAGKSARLCPTARSSARGRPGGAPGRGVQTAAAVPGAPLRPHGPAAGGGPAGPGSEPGPPAPHSPTPPAGGGL